jgi:hypothetical protein
MTVRNRRIKLQKGVKYTRENILEKIVLCSIFSNRKDCLDYIGYIGYIDYIGYTDYISLIISSSSSSG